VSKKKVFLDPPGKDLKQFQGKYGSDWKRFVESPAGQAGLQFLRNREMERVLMLSESDIEKNSREYLSALKGYLKHEDELMKLPEMTDFTLPFEDNATEYRSPEQEAEMQMLEMKFREENRKERYA
jgi:hypothetical protein